MVLRLRVHCTCGCKYDLSEEISTIKITCPNCDTEHPQSAKIIEMLKIAKDIPKRDLFDFSTVDTTVISEFEDMSWRKQQSSCTPKDQ